jgi:hypothetical protein
MSNKTNPPHKYEADLRNNADHPFGYKDKFVANRHKKEKL